MIMSTNSHYITICSEKVLFELGSERVETAVLTSFSRPEHHRDKWFNVVSVICGRRTRDKAFQRCERVLEVFQKTCDLI